MPYTPDLRRPSPLGPGTATTVPLRAWVAVLYQDDAEWQRRVAALQLTVRRPRGAVVASFVTDFMLVPEVNDSAEPAMGTL